MDEEFYQVVFGIFMDITKHAASSLFSDFGVLGDLVVVYILCTDYGKIFFSLEGSENDFVLIFAQMKTTVRNISSLNNYNITRISN